MKKDDYILTFTPLKSFPFPSDSYPFKHNYHILSHLNEMDDTVPLSLNES